MSEKKNIEGGKLKLALSPCWLNEEGGVTLGRDLES
jgi:hypothetical protein